MKNVKYYLDMWMHWVWSYNSIYERPVEHCPMKDEPEESIDLMESYCKIITTEEKRRKKNHIKDNNSYENYSPMIQEAIQNIIKLVSDGRDMHLTTDVSHLNEPLKTFDHHLDKNGLLPFENDPFMTANRILIDIPKVREIINSEKVTGNFEQFYNDKWYYFEGYESGSMAIKFSKINKNAKDEYTFDGDVIFYETVNGRCNGDGIIMNDDVTDMSFAEIPYCYIEDWDDEKDTIENQLIDFIKVQHKWPNGKIDYRKAMTDEEMHKDIVEQIEALLDQIFNI